MRRQTLAALLAPLLLAAVASFQLYLARTTLLTPWKGGGFGMFSTVDAPSARFLRIVLETADGKEIRVGVPDTLRRQAAVARAAPSDRRIEALGRALARGTWVGVTFVPPERRHAEILHALGRGDLAPSDSAGPDLSHLGLYRMLERGEQTRGEPLVLRAVRVEVWRYRFAGGRTRLEAEALLSARVPAPGTERRAL
jgi:hypothetical protein